MTLKEILNIMDRLSIVEVLDHATGQVIGVNGRDYSVPNDVMECEVMCMYCVCFTEVDDPEDKYPRIMGLTGLQVFVHHTDYER